MNAKRQFWQFWQSWQFWQYLNPRMDCLRKPSGCSKKLVAAQSAISD
jgi:hypothetical protein